MHTTVSFVRAVPLNGPSVTRGKDEVARVINYYFSTTDTGADIGIYRTTRRIAGVIDTPAVRRALGTQQYVEVAMKRFCSVVFTRALNEEEAARVKAAITQHVPIADPYLTEPRPRGHPAKPRQPRVVSRTPSMMQ